MNFEELSKIIMESADIKICAICGTPFKPRRSNQLTCGSKECMNERRKEYQRKREKTEAEREKHRIANRKWRAKTKALREREEHYDEIIRKTQKQVEFDEFIRQHGHEYGKYQMQKTLAEVPKIDVNIENAKHKEEDDNGKL